MRVCVWEKERDRWPLTSIWTAAHFLGFQGKEGYDQNFIDESFLSRIGIQRKGWLQKMAIQWQPGLEFALFTKLEYFKCIF